MMNRRDFLKGAILAGVSLAGLPDIGFSSEDIYSKAPVKVIGVGSAGCVMINNIISAYSNKPEFDMIDFIIASAYGDDVYHCYANTKIRIGKECVKGIIDSSIVTEQIQANYMGLRNRAVLKDCFNNARMIIITAGMGGRSGTGLAPVIAKIARDKGIFTAGVVTKPLYFEGEKRNAVAKEGIRELERYADKLVVIHMDQISRMADKSTPLLSLSRIADDIARQNIQEIIEQQFWRCA